MAIRNELLQTIINRLAPVGSYIGLRALTVQSYTEANSKNGTQHEASVYLQSVAGGASNDTIFLTGASTVILKSRTIGFDGLGVTSSIYESPTYTGGTPITYYNTSAVNPVTGLMQILGSPSVTGDGVLKFAPSNLIGSGSNQGRGSTGSTDGGERILKANTAYLFRLTNLDPGAQDITSFVSWFEGTPDLPLA
jgi:hypothetical protein